ncbi:MAG TPA: hypothetical protein VF614_07610 [Chthoniobacteraceae bacterium]|jgi:hypothetical protein
MNKLSLARTAVIGSLLYSLGFIGYLVSGGSTNPLTSKLITVAVMFVILALPTIAFYVIHLRSSPTTSIASRPTILCVAAVLFLLIWIGWTPLIIRATHSDPLGILGIVWVPVCQIGTWLIAAIALGISSLDSYRDPER